VGGGTVDGNLNANNVYYVPIFSSLPAGTAESAVAQVLPVGGTLSRFNVLLNGAPGGNKSYAFVVRKNGADTAVGCTVSGGSTVSCSDPVNTVTFAADDTIAIKVTPSGSPSTRRMGWTGKFVAGP